MKKPTNSWLCQMPICTACNRRSTFLPKCIEGKQYTYLINTETAHISPSVCLNSSCSFAAHPPEVVWLGLTKTILLPHSLQAWIGLHTLSQTSSFRGPAHSDSSKGLKDKWMWEQLLVLPQSSSGSSPHPKPNIPSCSLTAHATVSLSSTSGD